MPIHTPGKQILADLFVFNSKHTLFVENPNPGNMFSSLDNFLLILGILTLIALIPLINKSFANLNSIVERWCRKNLRVIRIQSLELAVPHRLIRPGVVQVPVRPSRMELPVVAVQHVVPLDVLAQPVEGAESDPLGLDDVAVDPRW